MIGFSKAASAILRAAVILLITTALLALPAAAQDTPQPPCGMAPLPGYAAIDAPPRVHLWKGPALASWLPPACTGWAAQADGLVVALSGRFRHTGNHKDLLRRVGAVSGLQGIRYWSVFDGNWRVLVTHAAALNSNDADRRRADFSPDELIAANAKTGRALYFVQSDSRSSSGVVYRFRVLEASAQRIVIATGNHTPVRSYLFTLFDPGELRAVYFYERLGGDLWGFYALSSASGGYAGRSEASLINRAVAFYRHFSGVATDGQAPLAPQ